MEVESPLSPEDIDREVLECARYGELDDLRALLDGGASANAHDPQSGTSALHNAAANGHVDVVTLLLDRGARCERNANGNTPLHWAALNGHAAVVALLLDHFDEKTIDALAKNAFGKSALTDAINAGHEDIARLILSHRSADPPAHRTATAGACETGNDDEDVSDGGGSAVDEEEEAGDDADLLDNSDDHAAANAAVIGSHTR